MKEIALKITLAKKRTSNEKKIARHKHKPNELHNFYPISIPKKGGILMAKHVLFLLEEYNAIANSLCW